MLLYAIDYSTPPIPMAILPTAPALYALKTVTKIEAARVGAPDYQVVPNGNPIVEFVYFQTAAGTGTAEGFPVPATPPVPAGPPPYLRLAQNCVSAQQPAAAFPLAGAINDLHTYTQWSWPLDGATAAYYGYDVNVEFVESYVNALYTAFSNGSIANSLHFRCVDRNNDHTLLIPNAIHVPSIPQQSALAAASLTVPLPKPLQPPPLNIGIISKLQQAELQKRALLAVNPDLLPDAAPIWAQPALSTLLEKTMISARTGNLAIAQLNPIIAGEILHQAEENSAAQQAKDLWFKPLLPSTRYTLDVVAGPALRSRDRDGRVPGSLYAIFTATDAIGVLAALKAYYEYEDSLTALQRVQFTTSRYATFTAQMTNAMNQLAAVPGATPVRHYIAAADPVTWLGTVGPQLIAYVNAGLQYLTDHNNLASLVRRLRSPCRRSAARSRAGQQRRGGAG